MELTIKTRGFTLIEVMLALSITAIISAFIYTSFAITLDSKQRVEKRAEIYHAGRIFLLRVSSEIQDAYLQPQFSSFSEEIEQPASTTLIGEDHTEFGRDYDYLTFTTLSHMVFPYDPEDNNQSSHTQLTYDIRMDDNNTEEAAIIRREDPTIDQSLEMEGESVAYILCENVRSVNYRYYDRKRDVWEDEWNAYDDKFDYPRLPTAIEIRLVLAEMPENMEDIDEDQIMEVVFTTLVYLPMSEKKPITIKDDNGDDWQQYPGSGGPLHDGYHFDPLAGRNRKRGPR
jgi:general secretion pathway protein J